MLLGLFILCVTDTFICCDIKLLLYKQAHKLGRCLSFPGNPSSVYSVA